jgi:hypothetical protein
MVALAFITAPPGTPSEEHLLRISLGMSAMVLIEFAFTGYLLTTLLAALFMPRRQRVLYPLVSFGLYLIHSGIFFVLAGNRILNKYNNSIQIGGACIVFAVTLFGEHLRRLHSERQTPAFEHAQ